MQTDRYTRIVLSVIAAALVADAARGLIPVANAAAGGGMTCHVEGPVEITGKIQVDTFGNPVKVQLDSPAKLEQIELRQPIDVRVEH
jgi:hypothetical protein